MQPGEQIIGRMNIIIHVSGGAGWVVHSAVKGTTIQDSVMSAHLVAVHGVLSRLA
jgi:hypothetical protein